MNVKNWKFQIIFLWSFPEGMLLRKMECMFMLNQFLTVYSGYPRKERKVFGIRLTEPDRICFSIFFNADHFYNRTILSLLS